MGRDRRKNFVNCGNNPRLKNIFGSSLRQEASGRVHIHTKFPNLTKNITNG